MSIIPALAAAWPAGAVGSAENRVCPAKRGLPAVPGCAPQTCGLDPRVFSEDPAPVDLQDRLGLLDGFYIPTRYPDSYPEGTPGEHFGRLQSEQALQGA